MTTAATIEETRPMSTTDPQPAEQAKAKRTRRAEPITKRTARNGAVSYEFRVEVGTKPDGSRDRRRFTYRTLAEARRELRRITSEVAAGTYHARATITVIEACDEWLAGRRGIRRVTALQLRDGPETGAPLPRRQEIAAAHQGRR